MLKLGQLVLDGGVWQGNRIVSQAWLTDSTTMQVYPFGEVAGYGWCWWLKPDMNLVMAIGHGDQFIAVFRDQGIVLVITADPCTDAIISYRQWNMEFLFAKLIASAIAP